MASAPLTFLEKRWAAGYSSNRLHESATHSTERKRIPPLDTDTHRNVSDVGRRVMLSLGRWLYANFGEVRGALNEQADFASSSYVAQYTGRNPDWGEQAEAWLKEHDKIIDVRGQPFNMRLYRRNLILSVVRDGDMGTVLVKTVSGYPMIQCIPAHRIGSRLGLNKVEGGPYDGARIIDGVIVNDYGGALAYRVMGENPWDWTNFQDVPARDMFLSFIPDYCDQVRGFSALASSLFDFQDVREYRRFELIAQKVFASQTIIEKNVEGEAVPGEPYITTPEATDSTAGTPTGLVTEMLDGGTTRYIRSTDPNAIIEAFKSDRPSGSQQAFEEKIVRSCFHGMGWSVDFSLDPSKVGRSEMRLILDKINRVIDSKQDLILLPACSRINGFRLSSAVQLEILPQDVDWWKWDYQGPAKFTADAKNESDMAINEHRAGHRTLKTICADEAQYWEDVQDQLIAEEKRLQERCKAEGIDPDKIRQLSTTPPPNNADTSQPPEGDNAASDESPGMAIADTQKIQLDLQLNQPKRPNVLTPIRDAEGKIISYELSHK
jgi:hypothetical protein